MTIEEAVAGELRERERGEKSSMDEKVDRRDSLLRRCYSKICHVKFETVSENSLL